VSAGLHEHCASQDVRLSERCEACSGGGHTSNLFEFWREIFA
jgi:hypothetical protein